jgi:bifunctional non-homologous end joining protein LigD
VTRASRAKGTKTGKLAAYRAKRDFRVTPEPSPSDRVAESELPRFVIQKHDATRLHYDFRLEAEGVLKSWAVPKGPSLDPADKRLAVRTEDHPMSYFDFEGVIPEGEYGGGPVIVWDEGTYLNIKTDRRGKPVSMTDAIKMGTVEVYLQGKKVRGGFALVRTRPGPGGKEHWLLIKMKDEEADPKRRLVQERPESVKSGRTVEEVVASEGSVLQARKKLARARKREEEGGELGHRAERPSGARGGSASDEVSRGRRLAAAMTSKRGSPALAVREKPARKAPASAAPRRERQRQGEAMPRWIDPMLATLVDAPPPELSRGGWVFEPKLDGFRALAFKDGDSVRLLSRNEKDLGGRFPEIAEAVARQPVERMVIDGEIVALDEKGRSSFSLLQQRLRPGLAGARRGRVDLHYYVFDLLWAEGYDTRSLPQSERTRLLGEGVRFKDPIRATEQFEGDPAKLLAKACRDRWEGLIAKRLDARYEEGRSKDWLKLKCLLEQEFVIGGYTDPEGSRTGFGSLLVGYYEPGARKDTKLTYAGKEGTGYSEKALRELIGTQRGMPGAELPFEKDPSIPRKGVHPVEPRLVCQVAFTEWTHDGHIRHPRFQGLREDKKPRGVVREDGAGRGT